MNVIIVDDEILVRAGMRMVIPWEKLGFFITGEAASSEEGIRLARELKPDLMLVDITMPGMSGLDMIKLLKKEIPFCRFIILSCHSEVEYLTSAIRIGVSDYIVKDSLNPEEITQTLQKMADIHALEKNSGKDEAAAKKSEEIFLEAEGHPMLLCRDFLSEIGGPACTQNACFVFVLQVRRFSDLPPAEKICEQVIREYEIFSVHYCTENRIVFFVTVKREYHPQQLIAHRCVETLAQTFSIEAVAGASECRYTDALLKELRRQAFAAADMKWIRGWKTAHIYSMRQQESNKRELALIEEEYLGKDSIYLIADVQNYLEAVHTYILSVPFILNATIFHLFTNLAFVVNEGLTKIGLQEYHFTQEEMAAGTSNQNSYENLYEVYRKRIEKIAQNVNTDGNTQTIIQIKRYIAAHLECKILLQDISEEVHLSRTYISSLFKKETGININDYITKEKLAYAKNLLLTGNSISLVVDKIGIQSESYFSKLFREEYRMTPSQFIKESRNRG